MKIEFDTIDELKELISFLGGLSDKELSKDDIQKLKKSERNRKDYQNRKLKNAENAESDNEEERVEEGFPRSVPSSPSSPNTPIIPITPIIPSSQEDEKEEGELLGARGELKHFAGSVLVLISEKEYQKLIEKFGMEKANRMIYNMDCYLLEDKKRQAKYKTRNHYRTLLNWERMDEERRQQQQPTARVSNIPKPRESRVEVAERLAKEQEQNSEVIDL